MPRSVSRQARLRRILAVGIGLLIAASAGEPGRAVANDSSSELAAGGLVLVKNDSVAMEREDLTISPNEIRVRYRMRNDTGHPIRSRVAFPMPEVPRDTPAGLATATAHNIDMPPVTDPNFLGFRVWSDGREVVPEQEIRAVLPDGRDVTEAVRQIGGLRLLLNAGIFEHDGTQGGNDHAGDQGLDAGARAALQKLGALEQEDDLYDLKWTTHITFHWMQIFRPGITVIEHTYRPIIGRQIFPGPGDPDYPKSKRRYCIDPPTDQVIRSLHGQQGLTGYTVGYILQTARNWRGPIGTFHITLEGEQISFPDGSSVRPRVMSLCTDLPLSQTGPMRFEATMRDYMPAYDLLILFL